MKEVDFIEHQIQKRLCELRKKYPQNEPVTWSDGDPLKSLLADLSHADRKVRREAAFALGDLGDSRAILPLAMAFYAHERHGDYLLYDAPDDVQLAIAMALFCLGESAELATVFTSDSGHIQTRMVKALKEIDAQRAVAILIRALWVKGWALSYWAARALGALRDRRALEPLLKVLQHGSVEERVAAADSLGELCDERAIPALEQAREQDRDDKNWMGRTVSQAATMAIDEILRSKGIAPRYAGQDSRYIEWVDSRFEYEAELFVAEAKRKLGITLGYDGNAVARLDSYINDVRNNVSPEERDCLVWDLSAFLGECIQRCYGGKWKPVDGRWAIVFDNGKAVFPFTKVSKFLEDRADSILSLFQLIPLVLEELPAQKSGQNYKM